MASEERAVFVDSVDRSGVGVHYLWVSTTPDLPGFNHRVKNEIRIYARHSKRVRVGSLIVVKSSSKLHVDWEVVYEGNHSQ